MNGQPVIARLSRLPEQMRFLLVGAWNTLVSVILYNVALFVSGLLWGPVDSSTAPWWQWLDANLYIVVFWLVWLVGVIHSTATMKYFAFRSPGDLWKQVRRSYLIYLPAQGLNTVVLWATVEVLHLPPSVGQLLAIFVSTIFSYLGHKHFTFRAPAEVDAALEKLEA